MNETIGIRKRDMVNSCPLGDELKRLRDNNRELLVMLEEERTASSELKKELDKCQCSLVAARVYNREAESALEEYKTSLVEARKSRDDAEEERDNWYDQLTHAKGKIQQLRKALSKAADAMGAGAFEIGCVLDDKS